MFEPNRLRYVVLSLAVLISACGAPGVGPQAPTAIQEPSPTRVAQPQPTTASSIAEPVETAQVESAAAERPTANATETKPLKNIPAEKPVADPEATREESAPDNTNKGPTEEQLMLLASLESRGAAPELSNEVWLNSEPLKLADLHGNVILVEFWTFG